jgi:NAD+ synthase
MDIDNSSLDRQCIHQLKKGKCFKIQDVDLFPIFNLYKRILNLKTPVATNNLKARLRMVALYALAQEHNLLVLGTGNADELYMGYFTKYGDGASDALPLAHLTKQNVFTLAHELKLPSIIINRAPSASLYETQTDEEEMGVTYKDIDAFLKYQKIDSKSLKIIEQFHKNNHHKFHPPIKPKPFEKIKGL